MYRWRKMTPEQRQETLDAPQTATPTRSTVRAIIPLARGAISSHPLATNINHGSEPPIQRMDFFSSELLEVLENHATRVDAWVVLPNHYHAVVLTESCPALLRELGKLHGRSSFLWNGEDGARGTQSLVQHLGAHRFPDDAHHIAAIHYVHHNPVKHGYVKKWDEWKWSSASGVFGATGTGRSGEEDGGNIRC